MTRVHGIRRRSRRSIDVQGCPKILPSTRWVKSKQHALQRTLLATLCHALEPFEATPPGPGIHVLEIPLPLNHWLEFYFTKYPQTMYWSLSTVCAQICQLMPFIDALPTTSTYKGVLQPAASRPNQPGACRVFIGIDPANHTSFIQIIVIQ